MMNGTEILQSLAKNDPVHEIPGGHRRCALCGARTAQKNDENVRHEPRCEWIAARAWVAKWETTLTHPEPTK